MPGLTTILWDWNAPLLDKAVALLTRAHTGDGALDLTRSLVVVPTAESSRRLREALALHMSAHDSAVMAPWVWHPELCLMRDVDRKRAASQIESLLAWVRTLQMFDLAALKHLLPKTPSSLTMPWLTSMAETMLDLQSTLGAGGLDFAAVAASEHAATDRARWLDLAKLEAHWTRLLHAKKLASTQTLKRERAHAPLLPDGITQIFVIGVADAPPLFRTWLRHAALLCDVRVCAHAPEAAAAGFHETGEPLRDAWNEEAPVVLALSNEQLHVVHDPDAQALRAADLIARLAPEGKTAVGVCDAETAIHLEDRLALEAARAYEPGGAASTRHGFLHFARLWRDLVVTRRWQPFASLLRIPAVAELWAGGHIAELLQSADDFADKHLPVTLDHAHEMMHGEWKSLRSALASAKKIAQSFEKRPLTDSIRELLLGVYGARRFSVDEQSDRDLQKLATDWMEIAAEIEDAAALLTVKMQRPDALTLSLRLLEETRLSDPRGDIDLVMQGWLELLWEPAPNLVVLGCNEENLPGILISHPFLPDRLRDALGLPCQATRYARDAYLLKTLSEQRARNGALHLLCGQWSGQGDALRPSRLLFLCDDKELTARVNHLFPKDGAAARLGESSYIPARSWPWILKLRTMPPRVVEDGEQPRISVSRLRSYLVCPLRYHLENNLRMSPVDAAKEELSPGEFGDLIHHAFKQLADEIALRDCTDEKIIADFLCAAAERRAAALYTRQLPFPVRLQLDSALQRLRAAAAIEAEHRAKGWRTLHGEKLIGGDDDPAPFMLAGFRLFGKIDRIDEGPDGEHLILDFKTSESAVDPCAAHLAKLTARKLDDVPEWQRHIGGEGVAFQWTDLQLPLYALAWQRAHRGAVRVGYFNLPTSVQSTTLALWDDCDESVLDSARRCAESAAEKIAAQIFWPPNEKVKYDDFEELFGGHPVERVVDPAAILDLAVLRATRPQAGIEGESPSIHHTRSASEGESPSLHHAPS